MPKEMSSIRDAVKRRPTLWRWEDDGDRRYIIFVSHDKELLLLNPVASLIYFHCNGSNTPEDIVAMLAEKYPYVSKENIAMDVGKFIDYMVANSVFEYI